jgi:hypothetical protein
MLPSPLIRIRVAQLLARKYQLTSEQAVDLAEELVKLFAMGNLDIVLSSWINDVGQPAQKEDFWDGVSKRIAEVEEQYGDWHPWRP